MCLSVIIVSWNVKDFLKKCLTSIFLFIKEVDYEIILVDNASTDGSVEMVQKEFPKVKLIVNKKNFGFAQANNQGIKESKGKYLLILNPDTEFIDDRIKELIDFLERNSVVGAVGCQILNSDLSLQPSVRRFPSLKAMLAIQLKLPHLFTVKAVNHYLAHDFDYRSPQKVEQIMGAFMLIPKTIFKKIGLFDEKFHVWFEEVDLCQRISKAGYQVFYNPAAKIVHYGGKSFQQLFSLKKQIIWNRSLSHYFYKHCFKISWLVLWLIQPITWFLSFIISFNNFKRKS